MKYLVFQIPLALLILVMWPPVYAAGALEDPEAVSWNISASKVTYDDKKQLYIAQDDVIITGGDTRLEADYVEFDNKTRDARAKGNVLLVSGEDTVTCNAMQLNLETETGTIYDGTVFMSENNFYIKGNEIKKTGQKTYRSDKGTITSCPGDNPDWKISGRDIKVTIEGYGLASHATLWLKKAPALYTPFVAFPVKTKRQTGFLVPRIASSDRKGMEYEQPFFWAISRNQDATLYLDHMTDRGTKSGIQYRYILDENSRGTIMYDYLKDDKLGEGTEENSEYSYDGTPDRTNTNRYWFRMKADQELPFDFTGKLDMDVVSDADYLRDFKSGYTGFESAQDYFENNFGRSIDDYDDTTRENTLNLNRSFSSYSLNLNLEYYDNVIKRRDGTEDTTLHRLPSVKFSSVKQRIASSPFLFDFDSTYDYFHRKDTTDSRIRGNRLDVHPTVYMPFSIGSYLKVEPYAGVRETAWYTDEYETPSGGTEDYFTREMYDLNLDLSTMVYKIYTTDNAYADKIKHEITPEIEYTYIPEEDQEDLPQFDKIDTIGRQNTVKWILTNRFISRKQVNGKNVYNELAWIELYQTFDINTHKEDGDEPFSDITLEAELRPVRPLRIKTEAAWSPYSNEITTHESLLKLTDKRGDYLKAEYRYERENKETLLGTVNIQITRRLSAYYSVEEDIFAEENIENEIGILMEDECWTLQVSYSQTPDDREISFLVELHGIGAFGNE
ncbi:MAG: LPS assembly protein LptD [Desulfarculaceae bacterium]|nr:LPS assembly protein LptD [Desulfarculaceae bacterium]